MVRALIFDNEDKAFEPSANKVSQSEYNSLERVKYVMAGTVVNVRADNVISGRVRFFLDG